jgi:hypothetical protein
MSAAFILFPEQLRRLQIASKRPDARRGNLISRGVEESLQLPYVKGALEYAAFK